MIKPIERFFVGASALICMVGLSAVRATAQGSAPAASAPEVMTDVRHDLSPALHDIEPVRAAIEEADHEIPIGRFPHPTLPSLPATPDTALQISPLPKVSATTGLNFDGIGANGSAPSDSNLAVGATQVVEWVNSEFQVFDKIKGSSIMGPVAGNTLWSGFGGDCETQNNGDPIAQYDKMNDRWVLAQPVFSPSVSGNYSYCVAVSTTSDATGTYNRYQFPQSPFPDYPKMGIWSDGYYVSFNLFTSATGTFVSPRVCAMDGAKMRAGLPATQVCFNASSSDFSLLPADLDGGTLPPAGEPDFFLELNRFSSTDLELFKFHVNFVTPSSSSFTGPTHITVSSFTFACGGTGGTCVPQPGTSNQLDTLGERMMYRLAYRNMGTHEALVASHTVDAGGHTGVRWYEIRSPNTTPTVFQSGTFSPDTSFRWMPSIAMDQAGDIAMGYSISNASTIHPSIHYTGRVPGDAPGSMESENTIINGMFSQTGSLHRWGDYTSLALDPDDDCTFWYVDEYLPFNGSFNWSTRLASFKFSTCGTPDFTLTAGPASQSVAASGGTAYTAVVNPVNGFSGNVTLTASGLPTGATGTFAPDPIMGGSGSSTFSVTTSSSTPVGTYPVTITGTSGALVRTATVNLVVTDFTLAGSPGSQSVTQGSPTSFTATVSPLGGFSDSVTMSASGFPTGASGTFATNPITGGSGSSTLNVTTSSSTPTGTYTITLTGTDGGDVHTATVTLVVTDFTLGASPGSQTVVQGSPTSYTASVSPINGFAAGVNLTASGFPTGASGTFATNPITGGSGPSTLNVTTSSTTPAGSYTITITGTSGSDVHTATVTLVVTDFTIAATPSSQTVVEGSGTSYTATVSPLNGFSGSVNLTASGFPTGASGTFATNPITGGSGSSTLNVTTSSTTPAGSYTITVTGTDGSDVHTTTVTLVVTDFTLTATPASQSVVEGSGTSYSATVSPVDGFTGSVNLTASGFPTGASGTFATNPITGGSGSSTLNVTTSSTTPVGNYTITITGSDGSDVHTTTVALVVTDFTIAATPSSQTVVDGSGTSYTATVSPLNGFSGSVSLAASGFPTGASGTFTTNPITGGSGSSTLNVTTGSTTPVGNYTITITGSDGSDVHTTTVTLVVTDFTLAALPGSQTVVQGSPTSYTATVAPVNGFAGNVTLGASGFPAGASGTFTTNPVAGGSGSSTLNVTTSSSTPVGTFTITITGTDGSDVHMATVSLVVQPAGLLSFTPVSQAFGKQAISTTSTAKNVTVKNVGTSPVTFTSIATAGDFAQTNTCPASLAVGAKCVVSVTFTPTGLGTRTGSIILNDSAAGSPQSVPLSGTGVEPVTFSPLSLTFGAQAEMVTSAPKTLTLNNNMTTSLIISSIVASANFAESDSCGGVVAKMSSCALSVTFTPPSTGPFSGTLTVTDNASTSPQSVPLSGTGVLPVTMAPATLGFGSVVEMTSSTKSVTLTNNLSTTLSYTLALGGANPSDYTESDSCSGSAPAKGKCTIMVTFTPPGVGSFPATLSATDGASNSPQTVSLTGKGVVPAAMTPPAVAFGPQAELTSSSPRTVTLTNNSTSPVAYTLAMGGANPGNFTESDPCGGSVAASSQCVITVGFTAPSVGSFSATLIATDSLSNSPQSMTVSGTGVLQAAVTPATIGFGPVTTASTSPAKIVTLRNNLPSSLAVSAIAASGDYAETDTCVGSLAPGATCAISITFTPSAKGVHAGSLAVTDNAINSPQTVAMSGKGT